MAMCHEFTMQQCPGNQCTKIKPSRPRNKIIPMKSRILRQTLLMNFSFLEWAVRPVQSFTRHDNGNALPAELSRKFLKMTSQLRAALRTFSMFGERIVADLVPVAHDQRMLASRTVRGAARKVVYVAGIH